MSSSPRFSLFLRAIGIKPGFRRNRTGPSSWIHIGVAAAVGAVSGHYIFKAPLEEFMEEHKARLEAEGKFDPQQQRADDGEINRSGTLAASASRSIRDERKR